ncbi:hypothetical protein [Vibrio sp. LaRot3]|uniref:hypothetical protein n=1 Tax=Vibrio sp. LaRot3 TaxID=2998829 RepID=UPI0022CE223E|nr:hypothetical protein [Vibrio sp. LaRot3]MDA0149311.1 hypothetical protein [Vibrio sp. LaRot3]
MSFIQKTTMFDTQSLFSANGQIIGSSIQSPFNLGTHYYQPGSPSPTHHEVENAFGTNHYDGSGQYLGTTREDALGNKHFNGADGSHSFVQENAMGANVFENGVLTKSIVGDSTDAHELASNFMSGAVDLSDDLVDLI